MSDSKARKQPEAPNYTLSPEDAQVLNDVLTRQLHVSAEHSQVRLRFLALTKEYEKSAASLKEQEEQLTEVLKGLNHEQTTTLKQLAARMQVPEGYHLNIDTMTWEAQQQ